MQVRMWLERRAQDIRHAVARLVRGPQLTAVAFLTLTVGIGASSTIFSIVNGVLVRPLAIREPHRVITLWLSAPKQGLAEANLCDALFASLQERSQTLESLAAYEPASYVVTDRGEPEVVDGVSVTVDYFRVLGVQPLHGRGFLTEEATPERSRVLLLGYELWQRRFGGDITLLGTSMRIDGVPMVVVGVLPPGFAFPAAAERSDLSGARPQIWTLRTIDRHDLRSWNLSVVARLRSRVTETNVRRDLDAIVTAFMHDHTGQMGSLGPDTALMVVRLGERILGSVRAPLDVDPGFRARNVISGNVWLPPVRYSSPGDVRLFYDRLLDRVRHAPGVLSAGLTNVVPFSGGGDGAPFTVADHLPRPGEPSSDAWWRSVTPELFATVGIPILRGRGFASTDTADSVPVAIVDERIASTYWPGEDAIGKRIRAGDATSTTPWLTIVGFVPNVKNGRLDEDTKPTIYRPFTQRTRRGMSIAILASGDPEALTSTLRAQVGALDGELPIDRVETLEHSVARSVVDKRLLVGLLSIFAAAAVLLAALGIYGVSSLHVASRVREFGIRLAVGAQRANIAALVAGDVGRFVALGLAAGMLAAMWLTRLLEGLLFHVSASDATTFSAAATLLTAVAVLACFVPARRATRVDPVVALHDD